LTSSQRAITLELEVPPWEVITREVNGLQLDELKVPGFSYILSPGTPRLPARFITLGIPPGVTPHVQVLAADGLHVEAGYRLVANPSPFLNPESATLPSLAMLSGPPQPPVELASGDDWFPAELAQIVEVGRLRSQPFVRIRLNPFQYHPEQQELRIYERLRIAVKFQTVGAEVASGPVDEGPFEPALRSLLFNYAEARTWRALPGASSPADPPTFYRGSRFRVEVKQAGMYQLTRDLLLVPGQSVNIFDFPLSTFQLFEDFNLGPSSEVALETVDYDGDDRLDPEDLIRFYGRGSDPGEQRYTDTRVYWLVAGREMGRRMAVRNAALGSATIAPHFPTTIHREENKIYWSNTPADGGSDTHWYWSHLVHTDPDSPLERDYTISTPDVSPINHAVTLRAKIVGFSSHPAFNPDHRIKLGLGHSLVASATWDGQMGIVIEGHTTSTYLNSGNNTIRLSLHLLPDVAADAVFVDWFEIDYQRAFAAQNDRLIFTRPAGHSEYRLTGFSRSAVGVYDISDPRFPVRLLGAQFPTPGNLRFADPTPSAREYIAVVLAAPAILTSTRVEPVDPGDDLRDPDNGADYLIITHADLTAAANRLASHRTADFTVKVVQVQDIYNQFGNGLLDPEAIRDFLAFTVDNWSPRPQYVLLMGDGTYDYRNYLGTSRKSYIPPYLAVVDPWLGETADESYYATVSGSDSLPDLYVGRLPVNTLAEANAIVDKIISYEKGTRFQALPATPQRVLFVADDYQPERNAGNFPALADALAHDSLPDTYTVQRVYYRETHHDPTSVKSAIIGAINQGQQFVNYIGHAGIGQWAGEQLFVNSDVDGLNNAGMYPVVLGMTCLEGSFHSARQDALAEYFVRAPNKGAIASWSATGLGVATGHDHLIRGFYNALFRDGVRRLGPAVVAGKAQLYNTGMNLDLIHTFALLGDPALDTGIRVGCTSTDSDVTRDGRVDIHDLAELARNWRQPLGAPHDQDGNHFIDIRDVALVTAGFGPVCSE
jgi:hypothetical protein